MADSSWLACDRNKRHLLDFGRLGDALQVVLEGQDFGIFLLQDGDQVVQQSDVSKNKLRATRGASVEQFVLNGISKCFIALF